MTINSLNVVQSTPVSGLGTQTYNVQTTGIYTVEVRYTIPYVAAGSSYNSDTMADAPEASALQILVKLDATTKLTLSAPGPTQPSMSGSISFAATAGQVITVVPSSSAASDNVPNAVKGIVNVYQGVG
jgi:hypothetical protein